MKEELMENKRVTGLIGLLLLAWVLLPGLIQYFYDIWAPITVLVITGIYLAVFKTYQFKS